MKRLYDNIEEINIKGDISQLTEVVTTMDISLQNIADSTEKLTEYLIRYSSSNKGKQFEKVVNTSMTLRDVLRKASFELNEMQNQIVAYQNKIYRYEDMAASAAKPNAYLVSINKNVSVDVTSVQFKREDMLNIAASLHNYMEKIIHYIRIIDEKKNSIANVWRDVQYNDFAEYIDTVIRSIAESLKVFEEYIFYLEEKIKELN